MKLVMRFVRSTVPSPFLFSMALALLLGTTVIAGCEKKPLPVLFELPPFSLIDQRGEPLELNDLRGKVWVSNFFFTKCQGVCPLLTQKMAQLHGEVSDWREADKVRFVSISVDPEADTPEILAAYAKKYDAGSGRWYFLTGSAQAIEDAVVKGFRVSYGRASEHEETGGPEAGEVSSALDILHGQHFVLVDRAGRIRGYYQQNPAGQRALREDLYRLLREGPA